MASLSTVHGLLKTRQCSVFHDFHNLIAGYIENTNLRRGGGGRGKRLFPLPLPHALNVKGTKPELQHCLPHLQANNS